jgi:hypothetical protein
MDTKQDDTSSDIVIDEATIIHRAELVYQEVKVSTAHRGVSFAATAAKRLFTTEIAGSEAGTQANIDVPELQVQNDISKLTVLQRSRTSAKPAVLSNAGSACKQCRQFRMAYCSGTELQRETEKQAQEEERQLTARVAASTNFEAPTLQNV